MMPRIRLMPVKYTTRGFLKKLGLDGPRVLGVHCLRMNGRWLTVPEEVEEIQVVLSVLEEDDG